MTDQQWEQIAPLMPQPKGTGRKLADARAVVEAIERRWRTGCTFRSLGTAALPWGTIAHHHTVWVKDGTLRKIRAVLQPPKWSEVRPLKHVLLNNGYGARHGKTQ